MTLCRYIIRMKYIPGYENRYSATEDGRIYSHISNVYLKFGESNKGYYMVNLHKDGIQKYCLVHRLIAITFLENPDNKKEIDHIDRTPKNNNISNLRWCSRSENCINIRVQKNNKLGEKNIYYNESRNDFKFTFMRDGKSYQRYFKTLKEAIEHRDAYFAH